MDHGVPSKNRLSKTTRRVLWLLIPTATVAVGISQLPEVPNGRTIYDHGLMTDTSVSVFECPTGHVDHEMPAANYDPKHFFEVYGLPTTLIWENMTDFLQHYRSRDFDNWGRSYSEVHEGLQHWKTTRYVRNLRPGDRIFESACGIGMNLIITLETLHKNGGPQGIVVYGNEYIPESAHLANQVLDALAPPLGGERGLVCPGDSTDLYYVPSNSFDLVFTGYITPLLDPLELGQGVDRNYARLTSLCDTTDDDWMGKTMKRIAQERQQDWYAKWVGEMIRIAKPGAPIIIEEVSYPLCVARFDWGGVDVSFWKEGIHKFGWNVEPDSLEYEDDRIFRKRYHVFMRKSTDQRGEKDLGKA